MNKYSVTLLLTLCSYISAVQASDHQSKKQKPSLKEDILKRRALEDAALERDILKCRALEAAQEKKIALLNSYLDRLRILRRNCTTHAAIAQLLTPLEQEFKSKGLELNLFDAGYAFTDKYGKPLGTHILKLLHPKYADPKVAQRTINTLVKPLHLQTSRNQKEQIVILHPEHHGFFTQDKTRFEIDQTL